MRDRRLEARLDPATDDLITAAAHASGETRSAFIVRSARQAAAEALGRRDVTLMSAEQFAAMMASLDSPDPAPRLAAAARRPRAYGR